MGSVLICREAVEDSVLGTLALARSFARGGDDTNVVFTGEALHALDTGTFEWSPNFKTRDAQALVIGGAEQAGLALAHPDLDSRWSDVRAFVDSLADEPNLRLLACPIWTAILGLKQLPGRLESIGENDLVDLLRSAETIVGGY